MKALKIVVALICTIIIFRWIADDHVTLLEALLGLGAVATLAYILFGKEEK